MNPEVIVLGDDDFHANDLHARAEVKWHSTSNKSSAMKHQKLQNMCPSIEVYNMHVMNGPM